MSGNADLILAGINGGGAAGNSLANFAAIGQAAPTSTASVLTAAANEVQTITVGGSGLTAFTLTYAAQTTSSLDDMITAADLQTALLALSNLAPGDVTVTGAAGGPWTATFAGTLAGTDVDLMTSTPTGGTGTVTVVTVTPGVVGGWRDAGWCSQDGLAAKFAEESKDIPGFGSFSPVRTIVTTSKTTFDLTMLESNPTTLEVYHRMALGSIDVDTSDGSFDFTTGPSSTQKYAGCFDLVDGDNALRAYCPDVQVTDRGDFAIKSGDAVSYPVTLTAFPDVNGVAVHWFYLLDALAS